MLRNCMMDQRSPTWFSTGVPVMGYPVIGRESLGVPGLPRPRVPDVLGLIQDDRPPGDGAEQLPVPVHCAVACDDYLVAFGLAQEGSPALAVRAVMQQHGQVRGEPGSLPLPVVDHGCWADQQVGAVVALLAVQLQGRPGSGRSCPSPCRRPSRLPAPSP